MYYNILSSLLKFVFIFIDLGNIDDVEKKTYQKDHEQEQLKQLEIQGTLLAFRSCMYIPNRKNISELYVILRIKDTWLKNIMPFTQMHYNLKVF